MISLLASVVILGVLSLIAVKSLDGLPTSANGKGALSVVLPGGPVATGGATSASNDGAQSAVPGGLISQTGDTVTQQNLDSAMAVVDQEAASTSGDYGAVTIASLAGQVRGEPFISGPSTTASQISFAAAGGADGGVTLAVRSASGTCWYLWRSATATWFGASTGQASCTAPALASAPSPSANDGTILWQANSFPTHP